MSKYSTAESYQLPRSLLIHGSTYFKGVLEGHTEEVKLTEIEPETFSLFIQWLYTGSCKLENISVGIDAWTLGDYLGVPALKNCAMESLYHHVKPHSVSIHSRSARPLLKSSLIIDPVLLLKAYRHSPFECKLRKFLALCVCSQRKDARVVTKGQWATVMAEKSGELLEDIFEVFANDKSVPELMSDAWDNPKLFFETIN